MSVFYGLVYFTLCYIFFLCRALPYPSCGSQISLRLGVPMKFDRCAILASLHPPQVALRDDAHKLLKKFDKTFLILLYDCTECFHYFSRNSNCVFALARSTLIRISKAELEITKLLLEFSCFVVVSLIVMELCI